MGGNSRIIDRKTGEIIGHADKIDLTVFKRSVTADQIIRAFESINMHYKEVYGFYLWNYFADNSIFSGSSKHFFNFTISDREFLDYKKNIGDIDIMIPSDKYDSFAEFMQNSEGLTFSKLKYLGQDRNNFGTTFLSVFEYTENGNKVNIQIDFEAVDFEDDLPTPWSQFSHSSSWKDIRYGFKGVHHKFLLINLTRSMSKKRNMVIATPKSTPDKIRLITGKKSEKNPRILAFSVDRGLREKYKPLYREVNGKQEIVILNKKKVYIEIDTEDSFYEKDPRKILHKIFKKHKFHPIDYSRFNSFMGLIDMMKDYSSNLAVKDCFMYALNENLFGKNAQLIEKDLKLDQEVKMKFVNKMFAEFPFLQKQSYITEKLKKQYYARPIN